MLARAARFCVLYLLLLKKNAFATYKACRRESRGTQAVAVNEAEKSLWLIGTDGEVRVGDEVALAREVKRTLE